MFDRVFIIAEAGVNHNGSYSTAKGLIDAAYASGADAVKFQTFRAELVVSRNAPKAPYQDLTTDRDESQFEMLKSLELGRGAHKKLFAHCRKKGILFLSTAFDMDSIEFLSELGLEIFKIPSGEITNLPYLRKIGSLRKKIILSTGMSILKEIAAALNILISSGTKKEDVTVLHCNTGYPTPIEDVNLKAMLVIKDKFKVRVGYSDHTQGYDAALAAVALGASVIEKHFTLDRNMLGPDHKASLNPREFTAMARSIRNVGIAMGGGIKKPSRSESANIGVVRKSIVAARNIKRGERLTESNIAVKRPGTGISPMRWDEAIGALAKRAFEKDELIEL